MKKVTVFIFSVGLNQVLNAQQNGEPFQNIERSRHNGCGRRDSSVFRNMKTKFASSFLSLFVLQQQSDVPVSNGPISYLIGGIIAFLILGYLIYTLLRPEKF
jgi:K+-transporting ATPase KdpF subunit